MKLYILRHTNAAERDAEKYPDDSERPLTKVGAKRMAKIAKALDKMDLQVDAILSSPFHRARQTAEIVRKELHLKKSKLILTERLLPTANADALIAEIKEKYSSENLLLVGHEPDLSALISLLFSGETSLPITMKKGGICCLSIDELTAGKCATLEWLLNPTQLATL